MAAQNGKKAFLQMSAPVGAGLLVENFTTNVWSFQVGSTSIFQLSSSGYAQFGDVGGGFFGVIGARVTAAKKDEATTFELRTQGGQSTPLVRLRNESDAAGFEFGIDCIPKWALAANQTTTPPAGASKWFKVKDSAGAEYLVEGKVA